jgi:hypothetical protein
LSNVLGLTNEQIADALTDQGGDRGIDAVYLDEGEGRLNLHLFSFKYGSSIEKCRKNFQGSAVDKVVSFVEDLINEQRDSLRATCHAGLFENIEYIWERYRDPAFKILIYFCSNRGPLMDSDLKRIIHHFKGQPFISVHQLHTAEIANTFLRQLNVKVNGRIQLLDKQYFPRIDGVYRGLIATVNAADFIGLIADPLSPREIYGPAFNDNIRLWLGVKNEVNASIISTALSDERRDFWYLNNGITIVCRGFSYNELRSPIVTLEDFQIVNGGQTANALFEAHLVDPDKLTDVYLLLRIYETKDEDLKLKVAAATNNQTPIRSRDLKANDPIQKKLELGLKTLGYYYERKKSQYVERKEEERIDALRAGQTLLAYYGGQPVQAKTQSDRIFGEFYTQIFHDNLTEHQVLCSVLLSKIIESEKRAIKSRIRGKHAAVDRDEFIVEGSLHVLYVVGSLCERDGISKEDFPKARELVKEALHVTRVATERFRSRSYYKFFRGALSVEVLREAVFRAEPDLFRLQSRSSTLDQTVGR